MKKYTLAVLLAAALIVPSLTVDAQAETFRVKCEARDDRSRVSVDGKDLVEGEYKATITSSTVGETNTATDDRVQVVVGEIDEVEFDFDSDPDNIAQGASPIRGEFIIGPVSAEITSETNRYEIAPTTCKTK